MKSPDSKRIAWSQSEVRAFVDLITEDDAESALPRFAFDDDWFVGSASLDSGDPSILSIELAGLGTAGPSVTTK